MTHHEILKQLKDLGTAQNRKVYGRHGMVGDVFGVSFANLNQLKRKIKFNHELACDLWRSGNADARHLAIMIVDVAKMTETRAEQWLKEIRYPMLAGLLAKVIAQTPFVQKKRNNGFVRQKNGSAVRAGIWWPVWLWKKMRLRKVFLKNV
ncbi:MAG: DNA alkylation repair protein [Verrucomicrobiia bacterium]